MGLKGNVDGGKNTPEGQRRRWYVKSVDDEGDEANGLCPRCPRLPNPQNTYLMIDDGVKWCAACGWSEDWPEDLPLEAVG